LYELFPTILPKNKYYYLIEWKSIIRKDLTLIIISNNFLNCVSERLFYNLVNFLSFLNIYFHLKLINNSKKKIGLTI